MNSEWLRVMLDEIARKKIEAEQGRIELERRRAEGPGLAGAGLDERARQGADQAAGDGPPRIDTV